MSKLPGYCRFFTEVIAKKNIKQTDNQIDYALIKKIFRTGPPWRWDLFNNKNNKNIKIGAFFEKISVSKYLKNIQTNCITSSFGKSVKKQKTLIQSTLNREFKIIYSMKYYKLDDLCLQGIYFRLVSHV